MSNTNILQYIIHYINSEQGFVTNPVNANTKLITSRLVDSIFTLNMVNHLEEKYSFEATADEVTADNFETPSLIADYILRKTSK